MKIGVTVKAIIDTENITDNKNVKMAIERAAFNKTNDNLANCWAVSEIAKRGYISEIAKRGYKRTITLELL